MAYFDNGATTYPKPQEVYDFADKFYREYGVNVGRGQHKQASAAAQMIEETRNLLRDLFHCPSREVIFTPTATEALNIVLQGLSWKDGQTVYITTFEHNAVMRILNYLTGIYALDVRELAVDKTTLTYDLEKIEYQFQDKAPDAVVMSHASNVCGVVAPIFEICGIAKKYNAVTVVDLAQTAGLIDIDLMKTQADYAIFAGHKTLYSPSGTAGIICDKNPNIKPLLYGGTGGDSGNDTLPKDSPARFEVGSPNCYALAGLNASLKWIKQAGIENIYKHEMAIKNSLISTLCEHSNIKLVGYGKGEQIGVVSATFRGYTPNNIGLILRERDIAVRTGLHCSPQAHKFLGTFPSGTVRFSVGYFNSDEDMVSLNKVLSFIETNG